MTKAKWTEVIAEACKNAGTYREYFDGTIETLAEILETRDACQRQYKKEGSRPVIGKINIKGDVVSVRNPLLDTIITLNTQALSYWRDLGLTPSGLKKINEKELSAKKGKDLSGFVAELLGE